MSVEAIADGPPMEAQDIEPGMSPLPLPHEGLIGTFAAGAAILDGASILEKNIDCSNGCTVPEEVVDRVVKTARSQGVREDQLLHMMGAATTAHFWKRHN